MSNTSEKNSSSELVVSGSVSVPGILTLSMERTLMPGKIFAAANYNRVLHAIVKLYGELDGLKIEFVHGRDMHDWEIGMFMHLCGPEETLSIVAKHHLFSKYMPCTTAAPVKSYQVAIERAGFARFGKVKFVRQLDHKAHQRMYAFRNIHELAFARICMEHAAREALFTDQMGRGVIVHATENYGLRLFLSPSKSVRFSDMKMYLQVDAMGWAAGGFANAAHADRYLQVFQYYMYEYTNGSRQPPPGYFLAVLADLHNDIITEDLENSHRFRMFLQSEGKLLYYDSSSLMRSSQVENALHRCKRLWREWSRKGRRKDGVVENTKTDCYHLIRDSLRHDVEHIGYEFEQTAMWNGPSARRSEIDILAEQTPTRRTMGSMERLWFENVFECADKLELGWIKRRRKFELVETRTEFYVVLPVERRVSIWTKRSQHNTLDLPWSPKVKSETTLPAISAMCLFSGCVSPSLEKDGVAKIDEELFRDNIRNAGRGIGYALSRLEDEHRESLFRDAASWGKSALRLSSLLTLIWDRLTWLDTGSKAWVARETVTMFNRAGVHVQVHGVENTFCSVMYRVESGNRRPAILIDAGLPAGNIVLYKDARGESVIAVQNDGTDRMKSRNGEVVQWSYRFVWQDGNQIKVGDVLSSEQVATLERWGVERSNTMYN